MPVNSSVVVKTLRRPLTMAEPKEGSKKYFCLTSQVMSSRAWQTLLTTGGGGGGAGSSSLPPCSDDA